MCTQQDRKDRSEQDVEGSAVVYCYCADRVECL